MGITGLLPFLEKASKPCHISEFRGATVAIDTYCWLHKGANACAFQLASGEDTPILVNYCLKYIKLLQSFDIKPILVFDGRNLPAKTETDAKRREARSKARQRANELIKLGKTDEARSYLKQSINITPDMASAVIKECHKLNIDCIVAPYESDAQLAFFSLKGVAEVIISEDSDLMLFGCSKVLYKLDLRGCGSLVERDKIITTMKMRPDSYTFNKFRHMCILSGCDYLGSLPGIGLKKAAKFITLTEETNPLVFLDKIPRYLNMRHLNVTEKYKDGFMLADATFRHQTVFDPYQRKLVPLTNPVDHGTNPKYCENSGEIFHHEVAYQIALGNLHPTTHKDLDNWSPSKHNLPKNSIWSGVCQKSVSRKQQLLHRIKESPKTEYHEIIDEEIKSEAETKMEQEIMSYFKKAEKRKSEPIIENEIEEKRIRTSPVLQNPFLKKISKFQLTKTNDDMIVMSRYFCTNSQTEQTENCRTKDDHEEDGENPSSNIENVPDNSLDSPTAALAKIELNESNSQTSVKDAGEQNGAENSQKNIGDCLSQPCSSKSLEENHSKRKRLGTCRPVGLKRVKPEGQSTLHNFFNKLNKN